LYIISDIIGLTANNIFQYSLLYLSDITSFLFLLLFEFNLSIKSKGAVFMTIDTRVILMGINKGINILIVILLTAMFTNTFLIKVDITTTYIYIIVLLLTILINLGLYFYIVSYDYIITIQLLTDYGFGEEADIETVMDGLDEYCRKRDMTFDVED